MKILVQAGLVLAGKEGRWVVYRINRPRFREVAQWLGQFGKQSAAPAPKKQPQPDMSFRRNPPCRTLLSRLP